MERISYALTYQASYPWTYLELKLETWDEESIASLAKGTA